MNVLRILLIAGALLVALSCSEEPPVIENVDWRLLNRDTGEHRYEELAVFLRFSDPDGTEDLAEVTVRTRDEGFVWIFPRSDWIQVQSDGGEWWGLPAIVPASGSRLPSGLYIIQLTDLAAHEDERTFRVDSDRPDIDALDWPGAKIVDGKLRLEGPFKQVVVNLRDEEGLLLESFEGSDGSNIPESDAVEWDIWIGLGDSSRGFRLGPHSLGEYSGP